MNTQEINLQELEERFETTAAAIEATCPPDPDKYIITAMGGVA